MIAESCERQHIAPDQLTIHTERGPAMTAKPVALLLATLGVVPSHSRPQVSDDSPFSEAQFKTLIWLWSMNGAKEYVGDTR